MVLGYYHSPVALLLDRHHEDMNEFRVTNGLTLVGEGSDMCSPV